MPATDYVDLFGEIYYDRGFPRLCFSMKPHKMLLIFINLNLTFSTSITFLWPNPLQKQLCFMFAYTSAHRLIKPTGLASKTVTWKGEVGSGEMAQLLRLLAAFAEKLGSVPTTHIRLSSHWPGISSSRESHTFLWPGRSVLQRSDSSPRYKQALMSSVPQQSA